MRTLLVLACLGALLAAATLGLVTTVMQLSDARVVPALVDPPTVNEIVLVANVVLLALIAAAALADRRSRSRE